MADDVSDPSLEAVLDRIDKYREDMIEFLLEFGNEQSPAGYEQDAGAYLYEWMDRRFSTTRQPVAGDRSNVVGMIRGAETEQGHSLLFNAHIDTAFGNPENDEWVTAEPHRVYYECWRDGDYLYGDDIANDKGPLSAFLWAALAIVESGVELKNDLRLAGVVGEIQSSPVDEYQGDQYRGTGIGTRHLLTQGGVSADYAIVAETTDYAIGQMECGIAAFKITLTADVEYWPRLDYASIEEPETQFPGALHDASRAALALDEWAVEYRDANTRRYEHGTNKPSAGVGAMRSGVPYDPGHAPGKAALYLSVFLPPGARPEFVRSDIRRVLNEQGLDAEIELYNAARGYIADPVAVEPLVETIHRAHGTIRDGAPPRPDPAVVSMWRDINVFNEVGIPAVTFGPSRSTEEYSGTKHRCMHVDDLVTAAKLYAHIALETCGTAD